MKLAALLFLTAAAAAIAAEAPSPSPLADPPPERAVIALLKGRSTKCRARVAPDPLVVRKEATVIWHVINLCGSTQKVAITTKEDAFASCSSPTAVREAVGSTMEIVCKVKKGVADERKYAIEVEDGRGGKTILDPELDVRGGN